MGQGRRLLDTGPGSRERLRFLVRGLPDPNQIDQAVLTFTSFDADHPGEEGRIFVNEQGPFDLPADAGWDNLERAGQRVDVSGAIVAGDNQIVFRPGPLDRSYFAISDVRLAIRARLAECPTPPPPPPEAREVEIRYPQARYTHRSTWVVGCENNAARAYAFTARGAEHLDTDCEGLYRPGGDRRGDALFAFENVADATYEIVIGSRHTNNRNPAGALFLVNGGGRRISQRSGRSFTSDVWGRRRLAGRVEVILRGEGESESVTFVRLVPVEG